MDLAKRSSHFTGLGVSFFKTLSLKSQIRNLRSHKISDSKRKTLVSPSHKVSHFTIYNPPILNSQYLAITQILKIQIFNFQYLAKLNLNFQYLSGQIFNFLILNFHRLADKIFSFQILKFQYLASHKVYLEFSNIEVSIFIWPDLQFSKSTS